MPSIENVVPLGQDNAVSCRHLSKKLGLSERDVQEAILEARRRGYPICSGNFGYFVPLSTSEALTYIRSQAARLASGKEALRAVADYVRREGAREEWAQLEQIERELSGNEKTAYGAGTTTDGIRD